MEYSHGGVSLQEMVIPAFARYRQPFPNFLGPVGRGEVDRCEMPSNGGRDCSGVRVDIRIRRSDPASSLLADHQARETTPEGKVTVFIEDDADIGRNAEIILLDASGQVIDSLPTKLGE